MSVVKLYKTSYISNVSSFFKKSNSKAIFSLSNPIISTNEQKLTWNWFHSNEGELRQGSKRIKQRPIKWWHTKLPLLKITIRGWISTQLNEPGSQNSIRVLNVVKLMNKKTLY